MKTEYKTIQGSIVLRSNGSTNLRKGDNVAINEQLYVVLTKTVIYEEETSEPYEVITIEAIPNFV